MGLISMYQGKSYNRFTLYNGDCGGLHRDGNYQCFMWNNPDCRIIFSMTRQGGAATCHFTSDKAGLRHLKQAINEMVEHIYNQFGWCEMVLAVVDRPSVGRLILKCGFSKIGTYKNGEIFMRAKQWAA